MIYQQKEKEEPSQLRDDILEDKTKIKKKGLGLSAKATIAAFFFGIIPVAVVSGASYYFADKVVSEKTSITKITEIEKISYSFGKFIQERINNNKNVIDLINIIVPNIRDINNLTEEQKSTLENILTLIATDYLVFDHIGIYNLQGNLVVRSLGSTQESNKKDTKFFQDVLKNGSIVVSEPLGYDDNNSQRLSIYIANAIKDSESKIQAVVISRISANTIGNSILRNASLQEGTSYKLVDSSGKIFQNYQDTQERPLGTNITDNLSSYSQIHASKQSTTWLGNNNFLNAYTPVITPVNLDWSLITSTSPDIAFAAQRQLATTIAIGTIIMAILAILAGSIIANFAIKPVLFATSAVEKIGKSQLDIRLPVEGNDEFAVLNENINFMAEEIQNLLATLRNNSEQLERQNNTLSTLAKNEAVIQGDMKSAATVFNEKIAETLKLDRVTIWLYNTENKTVVAFDVYNRLKNEHSEGFSFNQVDYLNYINTLNEDLPIVAVDANNDPLTVTLVNKVLADVGIKSKLDIPISISGNTVGILACEQITEERAWQPQEQIFLSSVANLLALTLESEILQNEVAHLLDVVSEVEDGNLTVKAKVSDRSTGLVADTFNRLIEELGEVLQQVLNTAQKVSEGTNNLQIVSQTVVGGTIKQTQAVEEVLQLSQEVEQFTKDAEDQVRNTEKSLSSLDLTVQSGENTIASLTKSIEILQQGTDRIIQQMKTLGEFVGLADQFVQEQGEIAQQTQVLALNAALVAARAAEQKDPRRFEIVARDFEEIANQVGVLAQKTNEELLTLEERTQQIHTVVSTIDGEMQNLGGLVGGFTKDVKQSDELFKGVRNVTTQAITAGEGVAQSNQNIVSAIFKTVEATLNIEQTNKTTGTITKDSLKQSKTMKDLSNELLERIKFFKLP